MVTYTMLMFSTRSSA